MKFRALILLWILSVQSALAQLPPIGQWRDHLPWNSAGQLLHDGERLWWGSGLSIAAIDPTNNEIERWSKVQGLSETGLAAMGWNATEQALVVVWQNHRINIIRSGEVRRIEDLANSTNPGDKTVNHIVCYDQYAYLLSNTGIVVLDLRKDIVAATYIIGSNGTRTAVTGLTKDNQFWYAATAEGLKSAPVNAPNLSDYRSWSAVTNGLRPATVTHITQTNNRIFCLQSDTVFALNAGQWNALYTDGRPIRSLQSSNNKLVLCEGPTNAARIVSLNTSGVAEEILQNSTYIKAPKQALWLDGDLWYADSLAGLIKRSGSSYFIMGAGGPPDITAASFAVRDQQLYAAFGNVDRNRQPQGNQAPVARFQNDAWTNLPGFDTLPDVLTLTIDRPTGDLWGGSFGGGLFQFKNGNGTKVLKQDLFAPPYRISGSAFDATGQLWCTNEGAVQNLWVRKTDGTWKSFPIPLPLNGAAAGTIVIDDLDQKWILAPNGQGLICFNSGANVDNTADDRWKWYRAGSGNGNLPSNEVLSIVKDKNSFIWVGTTRGIGIVQCVQEVFSSAGCEALLPVVQQDNFAGYLFRDEEVQAMAVDGADRKWIGTRNGVWLISPDGEKTIYRFTSANSPLPSNDIRAIAIDAITGEVFFSTAKGIVSFRSTATEGAPTQSNVLVYPNPVPPGYTGTIAIRGLTDQAIVKITEPDGRLVFETRALGGQAIWNGKNYKGQTIRSGVYLVLINDETKKQKAVARIVFIAK